MLKSAEGSSPSTVFPSISENIRFQETCSMKDSKSLSERFYCIVKAIKCFSSQLIEPTIISLRSRLRLKSANSGYRLHNEVSSWPYHLLYSMQALRETLEQVKTEVLHLLLFEGQAHYKRGCVDLIAVGF